MFFCKSPRAPSSPSSSLPSAIAAESVLSELFTDASASLFCDDRRRSQQYLAAVKDLHSSMLTFFKNEEDHSSSSRLLRAQKLLQSAMTRLDKEFIRILASSSHHVGEYSVSNLTHERCSDSSMKLAASSQSVSDLKAIADCMLATGYGQECVRIFKSVRKPMLHQMFYDIGVEVKVLSSAKVQKMEWEMLDLKIGRWLKAVRPAVVTLLHKERLLCDEIFSSAASTIRDSCFSDTAKEAAASLLNLPEIVARLKKSPEKIFRTLDVYEAMLSIIPHLQSMFSMEDNININIKAGETQKRLADSVRAMLGDFEGAMEKEGSTSPIKGGGLHPLTRYVMNYLSLLSDYNFMLYEVVTEGPVRVGQGLVPETVIADVDGGGEGESPRCAISVWMKWLVLLLLCKLDGKAGGYKEASLAYIFLCNNLSYVVKKAEGSNLGRLLGEGWVRRHQARVRHYACSYERMAWCGVLESMPGLEEVMPSVGEAVKVMAKFNACFEESCRRQRAWVVTDAELRDEMKKSVARRMKPYRDFYERFQGELGGELCVRFSPDNFDNYISDLFHGGDDHNCFL